ncbi:MAG: hypothetical protein AB2L14_04035 [Candidatus Xenobiia bacterium LiM19]
MGEKGEIKRTTLMSLYYYDCPYILEIVDTGKGPFLSFQGSKKGCKFTGGGISIPSVIVFDELIKLISLIQKLEPDSKSEECRVGFFLDRSRLLAGETRKFKDKWFYRIKAYKNYFVDKETGEPKVYKDHDLKPEGRGYFIQEFDIPISSKGKEFASQLVRELQQAIINNMSCLFGKNGPDILNASRQQLMLSNGDLPWVTSQRENPLHTLNQPLIETVCSLLQDEEFSCLKLAERLRLSRNIAFYYLNMFSRYFPLFLEKGILLDRSRNPDGGLCYQATIIPPKTLIESPDLKELLLESRDEQWPVWKRVTFSNDAYPQSKLASYHYAEYEVSSICGARVWGIPNEINQLRTVALRLFDLERYYQNDEEKMKEIKKLKDCFKNSIN